MKSFFKMMKFELIRISRNKLILSMLLIFSIVLLIALSVVQSNNNNFSMAIFTDGINLEEVRVLEMVDGDIDLSKLQYVSSKEEGLEKIRTSQVSFFLCLKAGETPTTTTATFYFDHSNSFSIGTKNWLESKQNKYAFSTISKILGENMGIVLNDDYFNMIDFQPATNKEITPQQIPFSLEMATCIAIVLMFGLAYSISRDNETNVSKNLSYMPFGTNRYLLSKALPFSVLGILQLIILCLLGTWLFDIQYETNIVLIVLLSSIFIFATISISLIFSMLKSQIATIFFDMLTIVLPVFALALISPASTPLAIQLILNLFPIVPFVTLFNGMMFSGIIFWSQIAILITQAIIYYLIAISILRLKTK